MLNSEEFDKLCRSLNLSEQTRKVIETIRSSEPLRRVGGGFKNVCGSYASQKMGITIQFESHTLELAAIELFYEYDEDVLEYWDQAFKFTLKYQSNSGKNITTAHIPDFFVIRNNSVGFEEWKPEKVLEKLAVKQNNRYIKGEDGFWHSLPAEKYAQQLNLYYHLRTNAEIDWIKYRNIKYLKGYLDKQYLVSEETSNAVLTVVNSNPGITFAQLREQVNIASVDDINALIASEKIYIDISSSPLIEQEKVHVFRDKITAEAYAIVVHSHSKKVTDSIQIFDVQVGSSILWDGNGFTISTMGETKIWLSGKIGLVGLTHTEFHKLVENGEIKGLFSQPESSMASEAWEYFLKASPNALEEANRRYQAISPYLQGKTPTTETVSERTLRAWKAKFREAKEKYGCGLIGLIDNQQLKGNRTLRYSDEAWELIDTTITEQYQNFKQKNVWAVYQMLKDQWQLKGMIEPIPSHETFYHRIKQHSGYEQTKKRQGSRAANQYLPPLLLEYTTPRHGDRPFEIVHIDHTLLDIEIKCAYTNIELGRPWVTAMIDAYIRRILAVYITFDPPSYRSCMMVLRICVQRFGRFPETIVVDNGKEFKSIYFDTLLARFDCTKKHRPPDMPRFSSIIERWFNTNKTQFINSLKGNTQITKHVRLVKKVNNPKNLAVWTLDEFYDYFANGYCYGFYDQRKHPALEGFSPSEAFAAGLAYSGSRPHQKVVYDEQLQILTLPSTPKGTAKVQPSKGVRINRQDYWSIDDSFLRPDIEGKQVPVRYDPFDYGTAYAYVQGHWIRCISNHYNKFQGYSEREIMIATEVLRRKKQLHDKNTTSNIEQIAQIIKDAEQYEDLRLQHQRDLAAKDVRGIIEGKPLSSSLVKSTKKLNDADDLGVDWVETGDETTSEIDLSDISPYNDEELW
ncbi:TnsA endonuclease N-terminal domain-containing protein [Nostoc sp.]|uniref:TnsA endonuclease N-terminal domain-containing protein n=1 Tax=Nostoc sp. TaxID=1180 RepID=UPI002FF56236